MRLFSLNIFPSELLAFVFFGIVLLTRFFLSSLGSKISLKSPAKIIVPSAYSVITSFTRLKKVFRSVMLFGAYIFMEKWNFEGTYVVSSYIEKEMWKP